MDNIVGGKELSIVGSLLTLEKCSYTVCLHTTDCSSEQWQDILDYVKSNPVELRDNRYDQVVHMVTAASGAETFYQLENNSARTEDLDQARDRDAKAAEVWSRVASYYYYEDCTYAFSRGSAIRASIWWTIRLVLRRRFTV